MDILQLFLELFLIVNIEVIVSLLPKVQFVADQSSGHALLQGFDCNGERFAERFAQQQMHMVGHDNISIDAKEEGAADSFKRSFEHGPSRGIGKIGLTMPAGECNEMRLPGMVKALEPGRHAGQITPVPHSSKKRLSGPPARQCSESRPHSRSGFGCRSCRRPSSVLSHISNSGRCGAPHLHCRVRCGPPAFVRTTSGYRCQSKSAGVP
jgi:hypothetical protein